MDSFIKNTNQSIIYLVHFFNILFRLGPRFTLLAESAHS